MNKKNEEGSCRTMHVIRPLSFYKKSRPSRLSLPPSEGPHSGYLLIQGQDEQDCDWCSCFGMHRGTRYKSLPLPQDRVLTVNHFEHSVEQEIVVHTDETIFIPVPGQLLSSNLYYVIRADGEDMGHLFQREEHMFMPMQMHKGCEAPTPELQKRIPENEGNKSLRQLRDRTRCFRRIPPQFLRRAGWTMYKSDLPLPCPKIPEAKGLNVAVRTKLPKLDFDISKKRAETVVVGEWYCPFIFIREFGGLDHPKAQMEHSFLYRIVLNSSGKRSSVRKQPQAKTNQRVLQWERWWQALIGGEAEVHEEWEVEDGMVLLRAKNVREGLVGVGLSVEIAQKMMEDQRKGPGDAVDVRVDGVFKSRKKPWKRFGCYVLVERYVLRRMNGAYLQFQAYKPYSAYVEVIPSVD